MKDTPEAYHQTKKQIIIPTLEMLDQIKDYFAAKTGIQSTEWDLFISKLDKKNLAKRAILLRAGEIEHHLSFIEKGSVRFYVKDEEEKESTFTFVFQGNFFSAYDSFLSRQPCSYTIETLTETIVWQISYEHLQTIYRETKNGNTIGRLAAEELYCTKIQRELSLLNETAEQRYYNLFKQNPSIIQQIPLKYIASYIGITPQALSRIRRRIS